MNRFLTVLLFAAPTGLNAAAAPTLNRTQVLWTVPGIASVHQVPLDHQVGAYDTHTVTLHVGRRLERVYITASLHPLNGLASAEKINTVLLWVGTAQATTAQKQALIRVGQTYLKHCMIGATSAQSAALQRLGGTNWKAFSGWKEQQLKGVNLGWGVVSFGGTYRSALSIEWPPTLSRCPF